MAQTLEPGAPIGAELRRALLGSLHQAVTELGAGATESAVHKARKAGKRARATADLAARALQSGQGPPVDQAIRDAARHLSEIRDRDVTRGLVEELGLDVALDDLPNREEHARQAVAGFQTAIALASDLSFDALDADIVIRGLDRSWSGARKALRAARRDPSEATLHEWRKRVKRLMYQLELVGGLYPEVGPVVKLLDTLQEELGTHHDLCVLHTLSPDPELSRRADAIEPHVLAGGRWLFRARGKAFRKWFVTRP